ncbi:MAG: prepilin peptidase [Glaciihabitans sp.]|jgi:leader peptidase (prepilin peptidase)/N-methyltransferase|nr:prepilin peptidase [Glaciihabitans sp.]
MSLVYPPVRASEHVSLRVEPRSAERWRVRGWHWVIAAPLVIVAVVAAGATMASIPLLYLAVVTPELIRIDLRDHRLPNVLTLPGIAVGLATCGVESLALGRVSLAPAAAGAGYAALLLLLALLGGMGVGDVKLGAALGLASWLPFVGVTSPVLAFLAGGLASVAVLIRRGRGRRMAFGPFLLAGFWVSVALVALSRLA